MSASAGDLAFLPLGGTGEIGMNLNLYRCDGRWLAVDCGIGFGGTAHPEADVMMADPAYIAERAERLVGLVITHGHEDHLGAVSWLWPRLRCPVYATPFAAALLRRKLGEAGLINKVKLHEVPQGGAFTLAPFKLQFIRVAHSIPEAQALAIDTPHGLLLHTGDWKLDPKPLIGPPTDEAAFAALGERGVLAMICDSTNALVEGHSGSEADVRQALAALVRGLKGRVVATCFSSNVARIESLALAARAAGRAVVALGRSLTNMSEAARATGYLKDIPPFLPIAAAENIPDDRILILAAGSQGEPRSTLTRIAMDTHPRIGLGEGDTVIFSSRVIPGNERAIHAMQDALVRRGVRVMTDEDHAVHVSGHPARDELRRLYRLVRPRYAVPTHGEGRHLAAHAALAREMGAEPLLLEDGDILGLAPGRPEIIDAAPTGRLVADGTRLIRLDGALMGERRRMLFNGVVLASMAVDAGGRLRGAPLLSAPGLIEPESPEAERIGEELATALGDLPPAARKDDAAMRDAARAALRRALGRRFDKRPIVDVHLLRV